MAKKNESKPKKSAKVAADTAANEQNTTAAVENTAAENQEPATQSNDSLTQEVKNAAAAIPVTVVVLLTSPGNDALMLRHCLRSLAKNLCGVDATVLVVGKVKPSWLDAESFIECSDTTSRRVALAVEQAETERIVLMTDRMHLIRPVLLSDIAVLKADEKPTDTTKMLNEVSEKKFYNFDVQMPVMMLRSPLKDLLEYAEKKFKPGYDIPTVYFNLVFQDFLPIIVNWSSDGWVLPVVSSNPDQKKVEKFLATKKFIYFYESAEGERIVSTMKFLTPDPTEFEADAKNENPVED
ncbi:MAG: hypothetical protein IJ605_01115 [Prevotella sp.]|nr:hypothetical protein [Prevotella sp.]